jgi:hypothetical protein
MTRNNMKDSRMQYLVANLLEISIRGMQQNMHSRLFQRMLATTLVKSTSVFTPFLSMGNISRVCLVNLD